MPVQKGAGFAGQRQQESAASTSVEDIQEE